LIFLFPKFSEIYSCSLIVGLALAHRQRA
jgi:hypothetical protein